MLEKRRREPLRRPGLALQFLSKMEHVRAGRRASLRRKTLGVVRKVLDHERDRHWDGQERFSAAGPDSSAQPFSQYSAISG